MGGSEACATYFTVAGAIKPLNRGFVQRPLAISDRGDILYAVDNLGCSAPDQLLLARPRGAEYDIYDLTNDPNLSDTIATVSTLWPDGNSLVLLRGSQPSFLLAELKEASVAPPVEGPFVQLNQALGLASISSFVVSGDGLTFAFITQSNVHYMSIRAKISDPFPPPKSLGGAISPYWQISALSFDGLKAFVLKDWVTYTFEREDPKDDYVLSATPYLHVAGFVVSPNCRRAVAQFLPGGCQAGYIHEVIPYH